MQRCNLREQRQPTKIYYITAMMGQFRSDTEETLAERKDHPDINLYLQPVILEIEIVNQTAAVQRYLSMAMAELEKMK